MKCIALLLCLIALAGVSLADDVTEKCGPHPLLMRDKDGKLAWLSPQQLEERATKKVAPETLSIGGFKYEGVVSLKVMVGTTGDVICMWGAAGHPVMISPAFKAAHEWKFKPLIHEGKPAEYLGTMRIRVATAN
ncbi:MAG: energy transducer TonB [Acidobacteriia bacterium]|nr:energy transducer TonB [Terriglobia bacterium]